MPEKELSIIIKNYVTSGGIVLGALWAFWKWSFSEWLRRKRQIPAIDGELDAFGMELDDEKVIISLSVLWRNKCNYPVHIDSKNTRIDVYNIPDNLNVGPFLPKLDSGDPAFTLKPYEDMEGFVLEPLTESLLTSHYTLLANKTYLFRWKLYRSTKKHGNKVYAWTKELVFNYSKNQQSNYNQKST